jgi:hypothetical protein
MFRFPWELAGLFLFCAVPPAQGGRNDGFSHYFGRENRSVVPAIYSGEMRPTDSCMFPFLSVGSIGGATDNYMLHSMSLKKVSSLIQDGENQFFELLRRFDRPFFARNTSRVHKYVTIYRQAFLLALSSLPYPLEIIWKSKITHGTHWWDDRVDPLDGISYERLERFVANPTGFEKDELDFVVLWTLIMESPDAESSLRAFLRLTYGGLIQRAPTREKQERYLKEYMDFSLQGVDPRVQEVIREFDPVLFWMTTKTVMELMLQTELKDHRTLSVLLDSLFGSALFYDNAREEAFHGELPFPPTQMPKPKRHAELIEKVSSLLLAYELKSAPLRVLQIKYTVKSIRGRLPLEVKQAYDEHVRAWTPILEGQVGTSTLLNSQILHLRKLKEEDILEAFRSVPR